MRPTKGRHTQHQLEGSTVNYRYTIVTLCELMAVNRNGELGFSRCADHVRTEAIRQEFASRATRRAHAAAELRAVIGQLGGDGDPATRAMIRVPDRRGWVNLPSALALNDEGALIDECERGEDHALEIYRNALDDHLPEFVRQLVLRQFEDMMSDQDRIRFLRNEAPQSGIVGASVGGHARQ